MHAQNYTLKTIKIRIFHNLRYIHIYRNTHGNLMRIFTPICHKLRENMCVHNIYIYIISAHLYTYI